MICNDILFILIDLILNENTIKSAKNTVNPTILDELDSKCLDKVKISKNLRRINKITRDFIDKKYMKNKENSFGFKCCYNLFIFEQTNIRYCEYHGNTIIPYITRKIYDYKQTLNKDIEKNRIQTSMDSMLSINNLENNSFIHFDENKLKDANFNKILNILLDHNNLRIIYYCCGRKGICISKKVNIF